MKRALLVTGHDPTVAPTAEVARANQIVRLLSAADCSCDHLSVSQADAHGAAPATVPGVQSMAFARLSKDDAKRADRAQVLEALVAGMSPSGTYDLIFQCGTAVSREMFPGTPRVFDAHDGNVRAWADWGSDLFLAADEQMRQAGGTNAVLSARWPLALPQVGVRSALGQHVGWVGAIDADLAGKWGDLLDQLVARQINLPDGVLVPENVRVPAMLRHSTARSENYSEDAQAHALGLAVLPGGPPAHHLSRIVRLVAQGVPVLTTPNIASRFDDRWRLPVSETVDGFLDWVHGWVDGRDRDRLASATAETAAAMREDLANMTEYVGSLLRQMLASAPRPEAVEPL